MAHNDTEQHKQATPTADVPAGNRVRSFAGVNLGINDQEITAAVLARADEDFARLFGTR